MILNGPYQSNKQEISLPYSKSELVRFIIASCLTGSSDIPQDYLINEDAVSALRVGKQLFSLINGEDVAEIHCGESGLCLNIAAFVSSTTDKKIKLTGEKTLLKRDISPLLSALKECGIECEGEGNNLPLTIGKISEGNIVLDCSRSTQPITGILFATPFFSNEKIIDVQTLKDDAGYIDMTIDIMKYFGLYPKAKIIPFDTIGKKIGVAENFTVSTDATHGTNFSVLGALLGEVTFSEKQGTLKIQGKTDEFLSKILRKVGAMVTMKNGRIRHVTKGELKPFEADISSFPDLFPPLVALACNIKGNSIIRGIGRLKYKESNRAEVIMEEFSKIGADISIDWDNDCVSVCGATIQQNPYPKFIIDSHGDHRIAMAAALLPSISDIQIEILNSECVAKTYPEYFDVIGNFIRS